MILHAATFIYYVVEANSDRSVTIFMISCVVWSKLPVPHYLAKVREEFFHFLKKKSLAQDPYS